MNSYKGIYYRILWDGTIRMADVQQLFFQMGAISALRVSINEHRAHGDPHLHRQPVDMDGDRRRLARLVIRDGGVHRLCRNGHDLAMRKLLAAILLFVSVAALAVTRTVPSAAVTGGIETPLPIGSNYLYFANSANAIKYLNGRTISGTAPNLTGVKGIAADVQGTFRTISGTLAGSGAGQTMTIGIPFYMTVPVGEHVAFTSISPPNWNENCVVTASSPGFITCANRKASGTYSGNGLFTWNNTSISSYAARPWNCIYRFHWRRLPKSPLQ